MGWTPNDMFSSIHSRSTSRKAVKKIVLATLLAALGPRLLWRVGRMLYAAGRREPQNGIAINGERGLIEAALAGQASPIVFDVGANVGEWTESVLSACPAAKIFAFEPAPELAARIAIPGVRVIRCAVSDTIGTLKFYVKEGLAGTNSLSPGDTGGTEIEVESTTICEFARQHQIDHIRLLKIDVEGFDLSVLRGALPMIENGQIDVIQFEYNALWIHTRSLLRDVFELVGGLPYRLGKVTPQGVLLYSHWHFELERYFEGNYCLIRNDLLPSFPTWEMTLDHHNTFAPQ